MRSITNRFFRTCIIPALVALSFSTARADVTLPKILSSHMVLQREQPVHLWGWSDVGEQVSVTLDRASQTTAGDKSGRWSLYFPPQPAGGPFEIKIAGKNHIVLKDVLIGDVWFASGQSNMEMPLKGFPGSAVVKNGAQEIAQANQPTLRLLIVDRKASPVPLADLANEHSWTECTPETAANFSAAGYFFGREIAADQHVPIGVIDSSWGGTPAEAWISLEGIAADASLMPLFASRGQMVEEQAAVASTIAAEKQADAEARSKNLPLPKHPWRPDLASWDPSWLFNGMVAPLIEYPIKGVIWYQGESNADPGRAALYEKVFGTLIGDWRAHWREGNFPFLFVQIANFNAGADADWPAVREAQRRTLKLANTAMAVSIDVGEPDNIHPADKQAVGHRLALGARAVAYRENLEYSGPAYRGASTEENGVRVWFDHVGEGLTVKGGALHGFEIAGEDRRFVSAVATIDGSSVLLTNPQVARPKYVRYGWQNAPVVNLFNSADLPASPFTTETATTKR